MRLLPGVIHPPAGADRFAARRAFLLFCLAPHGVCRASFLAVGAVGSYPAVSPLPAVADWRFVFCDTFRDAGSLRRPHACAWHAALWCPDFPPVRMMPKHHRRATPPADPRAVLHPAQVMPRAIFFPSEIPACFSAPDSVWMHGNDRRL